MTGIDAPALIGRCTGCGRAFRAELTADAPVLQGVHWRVANGYARAGGFQTWHGCRDGLRCAEGENGLPECGDWACEGHDRTEIRYKVLRSAWKPEAVCSPGSCHLAKSATCTCSCRGRNHGSAWRVTAAA